MNKTIAELLLPLLLVAACAPLPPDVQPPPAQPAARAWPSPPILAPCGPCAGWWDWGHRQTICASPSEGLWDAEHACLCAGAGAPSCSAWCASYAACEAGGDPSCSIPDDPSCDLAMSAGGACHAEAFACGADHTGCVSCPAWLDGADPQWLCPMTGGPPSSIDPAMTVSACACSGGCSAKCAPACPGGLFDPNLASFGCGTCLAGGACSQQYATCGLN